jgi:ribosomal protein L7/L12
MRAFAIHDVSTRKSGQHLLPPNRRKTSFGACPPDVRSDVERLIAEGKLIEAIRDVRLGLNIGLKEAKDAVEEIRRKTGSKSARAP